MQFEGYRRSSHIPNLTPLIDIVFLLLIFFMLTSHFVQDESLTIDLPEAETGSTIADDKTLEVIISENGLLKYKSNVVTLSQLEKILTTDLKTSNNKSVRIKGDQSIEFGQAVEVMDVVRQAGASGVEIITEQK